MLETSNDILFIAIAISVVGFTLFVCWAIFYLAMMLREGLKIFKEMRGRLHKLDDLVKSLKDKIEKSTFYLMLIGDGVKKLVEVIKEHSDSKKEKKKENKNK